MSRTTQAGSARRRFLLPALALTAWSWLIGMAGTAPAAQTDGDPHPAMRELMNELDSLEDADRKREIFDDIIAGYRRSCDPKMRRLVARATWQRALLASTREGKITMLDAMIACYAANTIATVRIEVALAEISKADLLDDPADRRGLFAEVAAKLDDHPDIEARRLTAYARRRRAESITVPLEKIAAFNDIAAAYADDDDAYLRLLTADTLLKTAIATGKAAKKDAILDRIIDTYGADESKDVARVVAIARDHKAAGPADEDD